MPSSPSSHRMARLRGHSEVSKDGMKAASSLQYDELSHDTMSIEVSSTMNVHDVPKKWHKCSDAHNLCSTHRSQQCTPGQCLASSCPCRRVCSKRRATGPGSGTGASCECTARGSSSTSLTRAKRRLAACSRWRTSRLPRRLLRRLRCVRLASGYYTSAADRKSSATHGWRPSSRWPSPLAGWRWIVVGHRPRCPRWRASKR